MFHLQLLIDLLHSLMLVSVLMETMVHHFMRGTGDRVIIIKGPTHYDVHAMLSGDLKRYRQLAIELGSGNRYFPN